MSYFFTSESVSQGHPDKVADQISDAIVDNFIARDPESHCAIETLVTTGQVVVAGEVKSDIYVDIQSVVRDTINKIGYTKAEYQFDGNSCGILSAIHEQSGDIDMGVSRKSKINQGAGDQGIMFGYATNETENYMPATLDIAHKIVKELAIIRETTDIMPYLRPDAKSQVTIEYSDDNKPIRITDIVVSTQHDEFDTDEEMLKKIKHDIKSYVIPRVILKCTPYMQKWFDSRIKYFINPTGKFVIGGPHGDTGLTGRKIIVDTYGGWGAHGGGAFCVDGDTEYLSPEGWKKIKDYNGGLVAEFDTDRHIHFVKPLVYHKHPAGKMYHIYNPTVLDMVVSEYHDMVLISSQDQIMKKLVKDLIDPSEMEIRARNNGDVPIAFLYDDNKEELNLTDEEIKVQVLVCLYGVYLEDGDKVKLVPGKGSNYKLIEQTLIDSGIEYEKYLNRKFQPRYVLRPPIATTSYKSAFKDASFRQRELVISELTEKWMTGVNRVVLTDNLEEATFLQWCCVSIGYGTTFEEKKYEDDERTFYDVCVRNSQFGLTRYALPSHKIKVEEFIPEDGYMYCFTVPTSMFVCRRNNKVFVTGNCGKDVSKVDRSAAYMARYMAKNCVAAGIAERMLIQLSYAIGVAEPVSIFVDTYGTSQVDMTDGEIADILKKNFDLRPYAIEQRLKLRNPIYLETAAYGHMGQEPRTVTKVFESKYDEPIERTVELFTWEKLDAVDDIKKLFNVI